MGRIVSPARRGPEALFREAGCGQGEPLSSIGLGDHASGPGAQAAQLNALGNHAHCSGLHPADSGSGTRRPFTWVRLRIRASA